jgi:hypothetical protein
MLGGARPRSGNRRRNDNNTEATPTVVWPAHKPADSAAGVFSRRNMESALMDLSK